MTGDENPGAAASNQVQVSHVFSAPPEVVFAAWTDPEQIARWWAPTGLEIPRDTVDVDARVGGRIHFSMVEIGGGAAYPVHFEIVELSAPELLVLTSEAMPEVGIAEPTVTRAVFEATGDGGTRVTVTTGPHDAEMRQNAEAGWISCLENLEALLGA